MHACPWNEAKCVALSSSLTLTPSPFIALKCALRLGHNRGICYTDIGPNATTVSPVCMCYNRGTHKENGRRGLVFQWPFSIRF